MTMTVTMVVIFVFYIYVWYSVFFQFSHPIFGVWGWGRKTGDWGAHPGGLYLSKMLTPRAASVHEQDHRDDDGCDDDENDDDDDDEAFDV